MSAVLIKSLAATLAVAAASNSVAFADEASTLEKIYKEIAAKQEEMTSFVVASSEERIKKLQESREDSNGLSLAENDAEPTS